ncbi:hypothetical protein HYFRA_00002585 [Hymenoscyphus fraxineus]|uniref:F-box domain-containing protein n=1 Tax=Hymenoscyphus fraxineus TaxID=746836 RepID=A0A9N9L633_9HELO|nr:hypothetical protein HYFRA_00002585 [Hymenoscyphus fraxineus]
MSLPNEIWRTICELSEVETAKNLRLVNKQLSIVAAERALRVVRLTLFPPSISTLSEMCENSHFSRHPAQINICECRLKEGMLLPKLKTFPDWDGRENEARNLETVHHRLFTTEGATKVLTDAIRGLPNLKSIVLGNRYGDVCPTAKYISSHLGTENSVVECLGAQSLFKPLVQAVLASNRAIDKLFIRAATGPSCWSVENQQWMQVTTMPFSALKLLAIYLELAKEGDVISSDHQAGNFPPSPSAVRSIFVAAANVERLYLMNSRVNPDRYGFGERLPRWNGAGAFENILWPRLRDITITNCRLDANILTTFLIRHSKPLKSLIFYSNELTGDFDNASGSNTWEAVISILARNLKLSFVGLGDLTDRRQTSSLFTYQATPRESRIDLKTLLRVWEKELKLYLRESRGDPSWAGYLPVLTKPRVLACEFRI